MSSCSNIPKLSTFCIHRAIKSIYESNENEKNKLPKIELKKSLMELKRYINPLIQSLEEENDISEGKLELDGSKLKSDLSKPDLKPIPQIQLAEMIEKLRPYEIFFTIPTTRSVQYLVSLESAVANSKSNCLKDVAMLIKKDKIEDSLLFAAENGHLDMLLGLLEVGADLSLCFMNNDKNPLFLAKKNNHKEIIKSLLSEIIVNATLLDTDDKIRLVYFLASDMGLNDIILKMLTKFTYEPEKVKCKFWYPDNFHPLAVASASGNDETVKLLLNNSIIKIQSSFPFSLSVHIEFINTMNSAFCRAAREGHLNIFKYLYNRIPKMYRYKMDDFLYNSLICAAEAGQIQVVQLLIKGRYIFNFNNGERIPLFEAAEKDHLDVFQILFEALQDVNARNNEGQSIFMIACILGKTKAVKAMLGLKKTKNTSKTIWENTGVLFDIRDDYFRSPLMYAVAYGHLEIVKILIEVGADINAFTYNDTPYDMSLFNIMENKMEKNSWNSRGYFYCSHPSICHTPLETAIDNDRKEIAKILSEAGASIRDNKSLKKAKKKLVFWQNEKD